MGQSLTTDVGCNGCKTQCDVNCLRPSFDNFSNNPVRYDYPEYDVKGGGPFSPEDAGLPELRVRGDSASSSYHGRQKEDFECEAVDGSDPFVSNRTEAAHSTAYNQHFSASPVDTTQSVLSSAYQGLDRGIDPFNAVAVWTPVPSPQTAVSPSTVLGDFHGSSCNSGKGLINAGATVTVDECYNSANAATDTVKRHDAAEGTPAVSAGSASSGDRHYNPIEVTVLNCKGANEVRSEADEQRRAAVGSARVGDGASDAGRSGRDVRSHDVGGDATSTEDASMDGRAREVVRDFVRNITRGISVQLVRHASVPAAFTTELITLSLDKRLRTLSVQRPGPQEQTQHIGLELVVEVAIGKDVRNDVDLPIDDLCVTLLLKDLQALSFRFARFEDRDVFALCISMFVHGRREEVERKRGEQVSRAIQ